MKATFLFLATLIGATTAAPSLTERADVSQVICAGPPSAVFTCSTDGGLVNLDISSCEKSGSGDWYKCGKLSCKPAQDIGGMEDSYDNCAAAGVGVPLVKRVYPDEGKKCTTYQDCSRFGCLTGWRCCRTGDHCECMDIVIGQSGWDAICT